ncbi:redoxin domain-containing protein [Silvibacterium acidisoli]|uniref:redoxin domain-containing protein n=1 Tax=Acidobacteriaceae bacterium ZG23-2 TaxID=2883246 RepID=UPI00406CA755
MKSTILCTALCLLSLSSIYADQPAGPTDPKAQKTFADARNWLKERNERSALDSYRKADKQDGGHCAACRDEVIRLGLRVGDFKAADEAAEEAIAQAPAGVDTARAHEARGFILFREGQAKKKDEFFTEADKEYKLAIAVAPNFPDAVYGDGVSLAYLRQDEAASKVFQQYLALNPRDKTATMARAQRYVAHPELARARMAPPFTVTTLDGRQVSLDDLNGKVVLIDFWATWCGPCREALPHIQQIAKKFQDQPLVVLSVSLDKDDAKWKDFVAKNNMTWLQYRDGEGNIANAFAVESIPHTFTIDTDGVLQDEHIGDASIEGKLKKLCAQARQQQEITVSKGQ